MAFGQCWNTHYKEMVNLGNGNILFFSSLALLFLVVCPQSCFVVNLVEELINDLTESFLLFLLLIGHLEIFRQRG